MIQFSDQELRNRTIEIDNKDTYFLGPDLVLRDCTITLSTTARGLILSKVQFLTCQIVAKKKLTNYRWFNAFLRDCRFSGVFSGCDFGRSPEDFESGGGIENCDFSAATLDGCRILNSDARTIKFPSWPCFTIFEPGSHAAEIKSSIQWPGKTQILAEVIAAFEPETVAVTFSATETMKRYHVSEDDLRSAISQIPGIQM
jgi:hypothetical protein